MNTNSVMKCLPTVPVLIRVDSCSFKLVEKVFPLPMGILESIQQQIADQLSARPFFADIPVLVEHRADIQSEYERALGPVQVAGGRNGVCVTILTPTADCAHPEIAGPFFDDIIIVALVQENVPANHDPVNGTGKSALTVCENLSRRARSILSARRQRADRSPQAHHRSRP